MSCSLIVHYMISCYIFERINDDDDDDDDERWITITGSTGSCLVGGFTLGRVMRSTECFLVFFTAPTRGIDVGVQSVCPSVTFRCCIDKVARVANFFTIPVLEPNLQSRKQQKKDRATKKKRRRTDTYVEYRIKPKAVADELKQRTALSYIQFCQLQQFSTNA